MSVRGSYSEVYADILTYEVEIPSALLGLTAGRKREVHIQQPVILTAT